MDSNTNADTGKTISAHSHVEKTDTSTQLFSLCRLTPTCVQTDSENVLIRYTVLCAYV